MKSFHMVLTFLALMLLLVLPMGCTCSSSSEEKKTDSDTQDTTDPDDTTSPDDTDHSTDTFDTSDEDLLAKKYPQIRDGLAYANMIKMLDGLAAMPDYKIKLPNSMLSTRDINSGDNESDFNVVFDPDNVEDVQAPKYDEFRGVATPSAETTHMRAIVDFLRNYMAQKAVPQGRVEKLGEQNITYAHHNDAYTQEEVTLPMDMGRFMWFRDEDTGTFTIHQISTGLNNFPTARAQYTTITGTPVENDSSETLYEYRIYQAYPSRTSDYNGKAQDRELSYIFYSDVSKEVLHYQRTLGMPFTIGRDDDLYEMGYLYRRYIPIEDSPTNEIIFLEERTMQNVIVEVDPFTGGVLRWFDDDEETQLEVLPADRILRFAAAGDDNGSILVDTFWFGTIDYSDANGNVILRRRPTEQETQEDSLNWFGLDLWMTSSWPLKYIHSDDPIEITDSGFYMVGEEVLPVSIHTMGMYEPDGTWNPDVEVPFLDAVALPDYLVMAPEKQSVVDQLDPYLQILPTSIPLALTDHPYYKVPMNIFTPLLMHGLDGVWILDQDEEDNEIFDVFLIDIQSDMPRFEYRRYARTENETMDISEVAAGVIEASSLNTVVDSEDQIFGGSLRFIITNMFNAEIQEWATPQEIDQESFLNLPDFLYHGKNHVLYAQQALTLKLEQGRWNDTERPEFSFISVAHDPILAAQAAEQETQEPSDEDDEEEQAQLPTIELPPIIWTAINDEGLFIETTFLNDTWQEAHFLIDEQREVSIVRAFRGIHTIDSQSQSGELTVTMIYNAETAQWVLEEQSPEEFQTRVEECTYLNGPTSWNVTLDIQYETMTLTAEEPAPAPEYEYRRQTSGVNMSSCLLGACVPFEASHCSKVQSGVLPGRGMSLPIEQWNDSSVVAVCTSNCWNYSMCYRAQRQAYYIDCTNSLLFCSEDWTPIDANSCDKIDTFPAMNQSYQDCLRNCQMDLEVEFFDPADMIDNVEQCITKYRAYPSN